MVHWVSPIDTTLQSLKNLFFTVVSIYRPGVTEQPIRVHFYDLTWWRYIAPPLQFPNTQISIEIRYGDFFGYLKTAFYSGGLWCLLPPLLAWTEYLLHNVYGVSKPCTYLQWMCLNGESLIHRQHLEQVWQLTFELCPDLVPETLRMGWYPVAKRLWLLPGWFHDGGTFRMGPHPKLKKSNKKILIEWNRIGKITTGKDYYSSFPHFSSTLYLSNSYISKLILQPEVLHTENWVWSLNIPLKQAKCCRIVVCFLVNAIRPLLMRSRAPIIVAKSIQIWTILMQDFQNWHKLSPNLQRKIYFLEDLNST